MIMRVRCGWCGRRLGVKFLNIKEWFKLYRWFKTTHGLCLECKEKIIDSVNKAGDKQVLTNQK